ncbi:MAG: sulfur oxidation c-type cytochrome SoxX [Chromatiales bacterium]|nr:sulfur oxidation c-type cytochrome SoxX [Chromatiales bacterium]
MTISKRRLVTATGLLITTLSTSLLAPSIAFSAEEGSAVAEGKSLAFSRKKGNCLACHMMGDGQSPGNIAPPLIAMKARYPDKAKLRAQIWDATAMNPDSPMPPFGKHQVISESELDKIVEYVWTL